MMKKLAILIICLLALGSFAYATNFAAKKENLAIAEPEKSFKPGEKLEYLVEWLGVPVGRIFLEVSGTKTLDGRECYFIAAHARPNRFLAKLYDIEYIVHSYIDKQTLETLRFEKTRRFKDKYNYMTIDFDHAHKAVKYRSEGMASPIVLSTARQIMEKDIPKTEKILNGVQDLLSSFYFFRLMKIEENHKYNLNVYYGQRNWLMLVKVNEPFIKDIRNKGSFAAFAAEIDSGLGQFILGKPRLLVYFTADSRRIPLEFKFETGFGPVRGHIQEIPR